ncbi:sushi domain-containing 2-like isoform X1, partial [Brachionus plicatilis]
NPLTAELIFDYGIGKGDIELSKTDIEFNKYEIGFKFPYLNIYYDSFFMSQFGYIGFKSPDFYINIYRSMMTSKFGNGSIFYQSYVNRPSELENMKELIEAQFGDRYGVRFIPTNAFVLTWFNIRSLDKAINSTVSFQIISISDEFRSFVIFSYGDLGFPCSEINLRHTTNYESLESFLSSNKFDSINQFSNVNQSGVFIFEVNANFVCDKAELYQDQNLYCTLLSNQSEIFKLEIKFCEISYTHESNGKNTRFFVVY